MSRMESIKAGLLNPDNKVPLSATLYYVYALWASGDVVYVGYTHRLTQRIHAHVKAGWADYDGYSFVSFGSKREALACEAALIADLQPKLNVDKHARRNWVSPAELSARPLTSAEIARMDPVTRQSLARSA